MRALRQAEFVNTAEIAQRFGLSDAHVRRLLRFTYLAPDILEAIVEGRRTSHPDRQAAAKKHTSRLGRPARCVRDSVENLRAAPENETPKMASGDGGRTGASTTGFETQRLNHLPRTPRNGGHFEHSSAISWRDPTGWLTTQS